ncbi:BH3609 [Halalkalibacterium halodurans C-125]|uniref:BH3609 protein n=1 Tax=Halalkalibacterium halodurans (strain ATCC BAA-125 / DSM 18197 / FERM 7344 / JCM 9153 / C-125) TaxID=272558 RepID=Q9K6W5_HALH5|nr:BH3609 [Halalkalibacterium halodurans C-125]
MNIKKIARSFKSTTTEIQTKEGDFFAQTATYQPYTMNQLVLPIDFSDLIPENHVARVVIDMGEPLNDQLLDEVYKGGGRPAYHPKMMTKILL